jgi:hypothetical protein
VSVHQSTVKPVCVTLTTRPRPPRMTCAFGCAAPGVCVAVAAVCAWPVVVAVDVGVALAPGTGVLVNVAVALVWPLQPGGYVLWPEPGTYVGVQLVWAPVTPPSAEKIVRPTTAANPKRSSRKSARLVSAGRSVVRWRPLGCFARF